MNRTRGAREATALALVMAALGACASAAAAGERADMAVRFAERAPGVPTALTIHLRYKPAGDPEGKPSPIRHVILDAPAGTRLGNGHPACAASDDELQLRGRDACPPESQLGTGRATVITGVTPIDPLGVAITLYATPEGFLELAQAEGTNATVAIERLTVRGTRAEARRSRSFRARVDASAARVLALQARLRTPSSPTP